MCNEKMNTMCANCTRLICEHTMEALRYRCIAKRSVFASQCFARNFKAQRHTVCAGWYPRTQPSLHVMKRIPFAMRPKQKLS